MKAAIAMFWWRVEVDSTGAVVSCEQVDAEKRRTKTVAYVRAKTKKKAQSLAAADWHTRHKRYQAISSKRLAERRRAEGRCRTCPKPICADSTYLCEDHLAKHREANRRNRVGESKPRVPADPVALKESHLAANRLRARLTEQLPSIRARYLVLDGEPSAFLSWLENEIEAREGSAAPRLIKAVG